MGLTELLGATALTVAGCMIAMWLLSLALRNASIVDIFWGLGFAVIGGLTFLWTDDGDAPRRGLLAALVSLWGLRLAAYLFWRNSGQGVDVTQISAYAICHSRKFEMRISPLVRMSRSGSGCPAVYRWAANSSASMRSASMPA